MFQSAAVLRQSLMLARLGQVAAGFQVHRHLLIGALVCLDAVHELWPRVQKRAAEAKHPAGATNAQPRSSAVSKYDWVVCVPAFEYGARPLVGFLDEARRLFDGIN